MPSAGVQDGASLTAPPASDVDPFVTDLLLDTPRWQEMLREAGSVVHLAKYGCYAIGRYAEVAAGMADFQNLISSAGNGLYDVRKGEHLRPTGPAS